MSFPDSQTITAIAACIAAIGTLVSASYGFRNHALATEIHVNTNGRLSELAAELAATREAAIKASADAADKAIAATTAATVAAHEALTVVANAVARKAS